MVSQLVWNIPQSHECGYNAAMSIYRHHTLINSDMYTFVKSSALGIKINSDLFTQACLKDKSSNCCTKKVKTCHGNIYGVK